MRNCTLEQFLSDVSDHQMTILHDDGVNRCVRFAKKQDGWYMHFTLTTWPGYLCITGDMGTFVFARLEDMFRFFRTAPEKSELYINPSYWAEKCEAADRRTGGLDAFSEERLKECVKQDFENHFEDSDVDSKTKSRIWRELERDVLGADNEQDAFRAASEFSCEGFELYDFWEHRLRDWTYHYIWCCYAIAWGIRQYDSHKSTLTPIPEVVAAVLPQEVGE